MRILLALALAALLLLPACVADCPPPFTGCGVGSFGATFKLTALNNRGATEAFDPQLPNTTFTAYTQVGAGYGAKAICDQETTCVIDFDYQIMFRDPSDCREFALTVPYGAYTYGSLCSQAAKDAFYYAKAFSTWILSPDMARPCSSVDGCDPRKVTPAILLTCGPYDTNKEFSIFSTSASPVFNLVRGGTARTVTVYATPQPEPLTVTLYFTSYHNLSHVIVPAPSSDDGSKAVVSLPIGQPLSITMQASSTGQSSAVNGFMSGSSTPGGQFFSISVVIVATEAAPLQPGNYRFPGPTRPEQQCRCCPPVRTLSKDDSSCLLVSAV